MRLLFLVLFLVPLSINGQRKPSVGVNVTSNNRVKSNDSILQKRGEINKYIATIDKYLLVSKEKDTTIVDTTLSIQKDYKFNYLQRDNFGLMPFANIGQTYNTLTLDVTRAGTKPLFGARARHFNYMEVEDMRYYEVPTPWTRLTYKTAFQQGQLLDAFFTTNISKQFNISIAYKGLRSLGNYQNALTSTGNFRITTFYKTKNKDYQAKAHITTQDLLNQENGGLTDAEGLNFKSGDSDFLDRTVFDLNFQDAESILLGKRIYFNHQYNIIQKKDSLLKHQFYIEQTINFEDKYYEYVQTTPATAYFGNTFTSSIRERTTLEHFTTQLAVNYNNQLLGKLKFGVDYTSINYGYDKTVILTTQQIPNRIKTNFTSVCTSYSKKINKVNINTKATLNFSDKITGNYINADISYVLNKDIDLKGEFHITSVLPNYNFLLYQSDYVNYNWYNFNSFNKINTQQIKIHFKAPKYVNAVLDISNINNYTFFNLDTLNANNLIIVKPSQYDKSIQYLRLKVQKELKIGKFALDNTIMYQNVSSKDKVLNVPSFITRSTLYYADDIFKKALKFQTGVTLNYFTSYNMNGYDPLLAEFYTQNQTEIGGFPRLDFFINAKIRQTRIFLKAEHFNSSLTGYDFFSAPNYPYRDFTVRFGLVWDFFL